ncbi:MAG: hypothetical protein QM766_06190 [Burkholderiaceae bacterium]
MLAHIPAWVFAVFALLVVLGWRHRRARWVDPRVLGIVAAVLSVYSATGVASAFGGHLGSLCAWGAGLAVAAWAASRARALRDLDWDPATRRVHVPGSWLPMMVMLGIFGLKFVLGAAAGQGTPVPAGSSAAFAIAGGLGVFGGVFVGRAWALHRAARRARAASASARPSDLSQSLSAITLARASESSR